MVTLNIIFDLTDVDADLVFDFKSYLNNPDRRDTNLKPVILYRNTNLLTVEIFNSFGSSWNYYDDIAGSFISNSIFVPSHLFKDFVEPLLLLHFNIYDQISEFVELNNLLIHKEASNEIFEEFLIPLEQTLPKPDFIIIPSKIINNCSKLEGYKKFLDYYNPKDTPLEYYDNSSLILIPDPQTSSHFLNIRFLDSYKLNSYYYKYKYSLNRFFVFKEEDFRKYLGSFILYNTSPSTFIQQLSQGI